VVQFEDTKIAALFCVSRFGFEITTELSNPIGFQGKRIKPFIATSPPLARRRKSGFVSAATS
jgi:hypothetical protein